MKTTEPKADKPEKTWRVEVFGRARKVGIVKARSRKEALQKLHDDEWDCFDTYEWETSRRLAKGKGAA